MHQIFIIVNLRGDTSTSVSWKQMALGLFYSTTFSFLLLCDISIDATYCFYFTLSVLFKYIEMIYILYSYFVI